MPKHPNCKLYCELFFSNGKEGENCLTCLKNGIECLGGEHPSKDEVLTSTGLAGSAVQTSGQGAKAEDLKKGKLLSIIRKIDKKFQVKSNKRKSLELHKGDLRNFSNSNKESREDFGSYLKFVNREVEVEKLIKDIQSKYFWLENEGKVSRILLCIPGSPGIGKSTFIRKSLVSAVDSNNWKPDFNNIKDVIINTVDSGALFRISLDSERSIKEYDNAVISLSSILLFQYILNINKRTTVSIEKLFRSLIQYNPNDVFRETLSLFQSRSGKNYRKLVIINIDETNIMESSNYKKHYLTAIINESFYYLNYIKDHNVDKSYPYLYLTFSGTNTINLPAYLQNASNNSPNQIYLPLLKPAHCYEVVNDIYTKCCKVTNKTEQIDQFEITKPMDYLINLTNGIPRYLEALIFALGCTDKSGFTADDFVKNCLKEDLNHKIIFSLVQSFIQESYYLAYNQLKECIPISLICHCIFDTLVERDKKFDRIKLSDLERVGSVFLEPQPNNPEGVFFKIKIPLVLLQLTLRACSNLQDLCPKILYADRPLEPIDNELDELKIFKLRFHHAKNLNGKKGVKLTDLFIEIIPHFTKLDEYYKDMNVDIVVSNTIIFSTKQLKTEDVYKELKKFKGNVILNGEKASAPDGFIVLSNNVVIAIQAKRLQVAKSDKTSRKSLAVSTVNNEHNKFNTTEKHLFLFITDEYFDQFNKLKNNEIVIGKNLLKYWMGDLLSYMRSLDFYFKKDTKAKVSGSKRKFSDV